METFLTMLVFGVIWGFTANAIIRNKGYSDNWFWWGFFFGIFAVIVACTKPPCPYSNYTPQSSGFYNHQSDENRGSAFFHRGSDDIRARDTLRAGGWTCTCGRVNAAYVSSCTCGKDKCDVIYKKAVQKVEEPVKQENAEQKETAAIKQDAVVTIREYKSLLDDGIITQEEFDTKKKQLLGL